MQNTLKYPARKPTPVEAAVTTMYHRPAHINLAAAAAHCIAANQLALAEQLCRAALLHLPAANYNPPEATCTPRVCLLEAIELLTAGNGEDAVDWLLDLA